MICANAGKPTAKLTSFVVFESLFTIPAAADFVPELDLLDLISLRNLFFFYSGI